MIFLYKNSSKPGLSDTKFVKNFNLFFTLHTIFHFFPVQKKKSPVTNFSSTQSPSTYNTTQYIPVRVTCGCARKSPLSYIHRAISTLLTTQPHIQTYRGRIFSRARVREKWKGNDRRSRYTASRVIYIYVSTEPQPRPFNCLLYNSALLFFCCTYSAPFFLSLRFFFSRAAFGAWWLGNVALASRSRAFDYCACGARERV